MYQIPVEIDDDQSAIGAYQTRITVTRDGWRNADPDVENQYDGAFSSTPEVTSAERAIEKNARQDMKDAVTRLGLDNGRILKEMSNQEISEVDSLAGRCMKSSRDWSAQLEELNTVSGHQAPHLPTELKHVAAELQKVNPDLDITLRPNLEEEHPEWAVRAAHPGQPNFYAELVYSKTLGEEQSESLRLQSTKIFPDPDNPGGWYSKMMEPAHVMATDFEGHVGQTDYQLGERALQFAADDVADGKAIEAEENVGEAMAEPINNSSPQRVAPWEMREANEMANQQAGTTGPELG